MVKIKTVSDFKKALIVGVKLHCINHTNFSHYDGNGVAVYNDYDFGTREVSIVQSNSFALKTVRTDGNIVDSWCSYPKASEVIINGDNSITILCEDCRIRDKKVMIPILTYTFV